MHLQGTRGHRLQFQVNVKCRASMCQQRSQLWRIMSRTSKIILIQAIIFAIIALETSSTPNIIIEGVASTWSAIVAHMDAQFESGECLLQLQSCRLFVEDQELGTGQFTIEERCGRFSFNVRSSHIDPFLTVSFAGLARMTPPTPCC